MLSTTLDRSVEDVANLTGDPIANEARAFLDMCQEWYGEAQRRFVDDLKFAWADSDNGYQWPNNIRSSRDIDQRPSLTINVLRQHNLMIRNQALQAKSDVKIRGTKGGSSAESAQALKWIIQHIKYKSNAQAVYKWAQRFQVDAGWGWWRLVTEWASNDSWDQEIRIRPVWDPLSVVMDPDARLPDKSDARKAVIFDIIPRDEFNAAYPELRQFVGDAPLGDFGNSAGEWLPKNHIMVAEYFRKVPQEDLLVNFSYQDVRHNVRRSELPDEIAEVILNDPLTRTRQIIDDKIEWHLIAGEKVIDSTTWLGKYIPLVQIVGEEGVVDGTYDCKGHTRAMKDAQRMFNYNASSQVEFVALQSKTPYIAPIEAIQAFQTYWETSNQINHAFLPYTSVNEMFPEKPIPPPIRQEPPNFAPGFQQGMETSFNQMMMASGQWQNQMGMLGNERTGEAISQRQQQGDTATFHFQDNYADGLIYEAKQLIDLIPKVYVTKQILSITNDDGEEFDLMIDPAARQAYEQKLDHQNQVVARVFNPLIGEYDVAADVGPAVGTRREQNVEQLGLLLTQAPALTGLIGDLLLKNMDFEEAQEAARRLRRMVPPQALGQGPTPTEQNLSAALTAAQQNLAKAMQRAGADRIKLADKEGKEGIEAYRAETDRMTALANMLPEDQQGLSRIIEQLVQDTLATHLLPLMQQFASGDLGEAGHPIGVPGAQQAPDGEWYLRDPTRMRGYLRVSPLAQKRSTPGVIENG